MVRARALTVIGVALAGAAVWRGAAISAESSAPPPHTAPFDQQSVWRTWKIYCDTCHFGPKARASLKRESLDLTNLDEKGLVWEKLLRKLRSREMPPPGMPRPDDATYQALIQSIEAERDRMAQVKPNPG